MYLSFHGSWTTNPRITSRMIRMLEPPCLASSRRLRLRPARPCWKGATSECERGCGVRAGGTSTSPTWPYNWTSRTPGSTRRPADNTDAVIQTNDGEERCAARVKTATEELRVLRDLHPDHPGDGFEHLSLMTWLATQIPPKKQVYSWRVVSMCGLKMAGHSGLGT